MSAHLGERALGELEKLCYAPRHAFVRVRTRLLGRKLDRSGVEAHGEQCLRHRVVQLAGQPVSLLQGRLALELAKQLRVVDGDRHLVFHRGEEGGVGVGGVVSCGVVRVEHSKPPVTGDQRNHRDGTPGSLGDRQGRRRRGDVVVGEYALSGAAAARNVVLIESSSRN